MDGGSLVGDVVTSKPMVKSEPADSPQWVEPSTSEPARQALPNEERAKNRPCLSATLLYQDGKMESQVSICPNCIVKKCKYDEMQV